jgi:hypothetical protein
MVASRILLTEAAPSLRDLSRCRLGLRPPEELIKAIFM